MTIQQMLQTHPHPATVDIEALGRCIAECSTCAQACNACADACLGEDDVADLIRCIRLNLDCAEICQATGSVLSRQTAFEPQLARSLLEVCADACRRCGEECERHAAHHEHCRVCADACRRCEQACEDVLSTLEA